MEPELKITTTGGVVRFTLNRPDKRNALTRTLLTQLRDELREVKRVAKARLIVLTAEAPAFCAGMDLAEMEEAAQSPRARDFWRQDAQLYREVLKEFTTCAIPTLAVVPGPVIAGGVGLTLACDMVLVADTAWFSLPEPQRGITASIVTPLLAYRVGPGKASFILLSGEKIDAWTALNWGLAHVVAPAQEIAIRERDLIGSILAGSPSALSATKQHLQTCTAQMLQMQLDLSVSASAASRETADAREGLAAFLEHRLPFWHPRAKRPS